MFEIFPENEMNEKKGKLPSFSLVAIKIFGAFYYHSFLSIMNPYGLY